MLSGIKVGWARAWRGLISAEMIFGAAQSAGIGVFINNARTTWIDYPSVYAAIILIIIVGVIVEYGISISAVAATLIDTVKYKVEHLTGVNVNKVNVSVEDIRV